MKKTKKVVSPAVPYCVRANEPHDFAQITEVTVMYSNNLAGSLGSGSLGSGLAQQRQASNSPIRFFCRKCGEVRKI